MSTIREKQYTCCETAEDFQIFCPAPALECGKVFALPAPVLSAGRSFRVDMVFSRDYLFTAASGISITVTACSGTVRRVAVTAARVIKPRRHFNAALPFAAPLRKMTVLRL